MRRWLFGGVICDIFNANDVFFSNASLVNLCCISMDRYIAIIDPFNYSRRMSKRKIILMLSITWFASLGLSHLPIHTNFYRSSGTEALTGNMCTFPVNWLYAIISSFISFWIPTIVMLFTYRKIYKEAKRQINNIEKYTLKSQPPTTNLNSAKSVNSLNHYLDLKTTFKDNSSTNMNEELKKIETNVPILKATKSNNKLSTTTNIMNYLAPNYPVKDAQSSSAQGLSNNRKRSFSNLLPSLQQSTCDSKASFQQQESSTKMKSEHKAARTLGVIMGVFLVCWLPFFVCYLTDSIFQEHFQTPRIVITILFWVGYCNSALNPIIYACFNRDFRRAFKQQLCFKFIKEDFSNRVQSEKDSFQSEIRSRRKLEQV